MALAFKSVGIIITKTGPLMKSCRNKIPYQTNPSPYHCGLWAIALAAHLPPLAPLVLMTWFLLIVPQPATTVLITPFFILFPDSPLLCTCYMYTAAILRVYFYTVDSRYPTWSCVNPRPTRQFSWSPISGKTSENQPPSRDYCFSPPYLGNCIAFKTLQRKLSSRANMSISK